MRRIWRSLPLVATAFLFESCQTLYESDRPDLVVGAIRDVVGEARGNRDRE